MRAKKLIIPSLIFSLLLVSFVSAAAADIILGPFQRFDIPAAYARFGFIIDAVLYFMILLGASRIALEKRFEGTAGKAMIVAVGIALTFGIVLWEYRTGFRLSNLWPLAMIIVFFTFAMAFYNFIKGGDCNKAFGLLAFAFLFFFFQGVLPSLSNWFAYHANSNIRLTWAVLNMFAIVALVWGIVDLITCLTGGGSSGGGGGHGPGPGPGPRPDTRPDTRHDTRTEPAPRTVEPTPPHTPTTGPATTPPAGEPFHPRIVRIEGDNANTRLTGRVETR